MLASLLAVNGGALVALMQAGTGSGLIGAAGWYFVAGLSLTLLAGFACWWAMVLIFLAMAGHPARTIAEEAELGEERDFKHVFWAFMVSIALLLASFGSTICGFVVVQRALAS